MSDEETTENDKVVEFEKYQHLTSTKSNNIKSSTQKEIDDFFIKNTPLTDRDLIQLELIESLAEHVGYLTRLVERLIAENRELRGEPEEE